MVLTLYREHVRHRANELGANWLADETQMKSLWNKQLEFDVEIKHINLDGLT